MGEELWSYVILGTVTLHLLSPSWGNCSWAEERKFSGVSSLMGMGAGAAAQPCCTTAKQCRRAAQHPALLCPLVGTVLAWGGNRNRRSVQKDVKLAKKKKRGTETEC